MKRLALAMVALAALFPATGRCGIIEVQPTTLTITPDQHIALLSLHNSEAHDSVYQLSLFRWQQNGTTQTLDPAPELIASPPLVTLPAHGSQNVRIGLRGALPDHEVTYRVILEEVPESNLPRHQGLNIALRLSLPLFVRASDDVPAPALTAAAHNDEAHNGVTLANHGTATVRVSHISSLPVDSPDAASTAALAYIMPGHSANFALAAAGVKQIRVQTDQGDVDLPVTGPANAESHAQAPTP